MRRSRPSTHCVFGVPQTINSATYQVVDVIARTRSLGDSESLDAVIGKICPSSSPLLHLWLISLDRRNEESVDWAGSRFALGQPHVGSYRRRVSANGRRK